MENKLTDIDVLLNSLFDENLRELFDRRLHELGISQTAAEKLINVPRRTLNGIIDATQKRANYDAFDAIAAFLNMPTDRLKQLHSSQLTKKKGSESTTEKKKFIRERFDLAAMKKSKLIHDVKDIEAIEHTLTKFLGYDSIFEYQKRMFDVAYSAGAVALSHNETNTDFWRTREFWLTTVKAMATKINNPYYYDRDALKRYFPQIRWQSTNVDFGLRTVIKALYKLGITVIFLPSLPNLNLRGATFAVDGQPCIALTDYRGFYATLWHCLVHELYHVLIDWKNILSNSYHISEDAGDALYIDPREAKADEFARAYFFPKDKLDEVKYYMNDFVHIHQVAANNNVHPSLIYIYHAYENGGVDRMSWPRARRYSPDVNRVASKLTSSWESGLSIDERVKKLKTELYN
jgi:hypothetical protein